jgi:signal transduction histidine kinase
MAGTGVTRWDQRQPEDRIRELEAERDSLRERLARAEAERAAAGAGRDAFLATASHELRNAVATLVLSLGAIERALATGGDGARIAKNLESSKRSVGLLRGLLDDMQDGARFRAGPVELCPAPADLAAIARGVVEATAAKARRAGVVVTLDAPESVPGFWDATRLDRALFHLLQNALRHARGSPVEIRVDGSPDGARVEVRDHGPGIDPADHRRIFEPFVRAGGGEAGGLGLGLFIARCCVEAHGGTIEVESALGAGARFVIALPLRCPDA